MVSRSSRATLAAVLQFLSAASSRCCGLTFARVRDKRAYRSFRAAVAGGYATVPSVGLLCVLHARYLGGAAVTSLSRIRPEAGLDPLITTKEPAYFVITLPQHA